MLNLKLKEKIDQQEKAFKNSKKNSKFVTKYEEKLIYTSSKKVRKSKTRRLRC